MTCPTPEALVPHALGAGDRSVVRHVTGCPACQAEIARVREAAEVLRRTVLLHRRIETSTCLDESAVAEFVEGRLEAHERAPAVAHLLQCARCRSTVRAAASAVPDTAVTADVGRHPWRRWSLPLGAAAAAVVLALLWPRSTDDLGSLPGLREPTDTGTVAPVPIGPHASVARVDEFAWSGVPRVERYRLRLYDDEGGVLWTVETADTFVALPDSVELLPLVTYFWKVEAQTEWRRWDASDLVEFRLVGPSR